MAQVYVTLIGHQIAVATRSDIAVQQATQCIKSTVENIALDVDYRGEVRRTVTIRVCKVDVDLN